MSRRRLFWVCIFLAWAWLHQGALGYILHRPSSVGWGACSRVLLALGRLGAAAALLACAIGLGRWALRRLKLKFDSSGEALVLEAGAGLAMLSYFIFALGLCGAWTRGGFAALGLACLYPCLAGFRRLRRAWEGLRPFGPGPGAAAFPILLAAAYALVISNSPPVDWDATAVHLEVPRVYAKAGALVPAAWLRHGFDTMPVELFFVPPLVFGDAASAQAIMLVFQSLMCAALLVFGQRRFGGRVAAAAVAMFLVQPAVVYVGGTAGTDFGVGLFGMLAFWTAWRWKERGGTAWLLLSGAFTGFALVAKLTGFLLAAALGPLVLAHAARGRRGWKEPALWCLWAAAVAAPWLIRTAYHTGNPVWPHFASLFHGSARDLWIAARSRAAVTEGAGVGLGDLLLLPFRMVFRPELFWHDGHFLAIPFFVLAAVSGFRKDPFARWAVAYALLLTVAWFHTLQNLRLLLPLMPWLALLVCAWAARQWPRGGWRRAAACAGLVAFIPTAGLSANNELFVALGLRPSGSAMSPEEAYLRKRLDSFEAMAAVNRRYPTDAKLLLYREVRGFYLERDYLIGDPQNEMLVPYESLAGPEALRSHLSGLGVTHVFFNPGQLTFSAAVPEFRRADAMMMEMLDRLTGPSERIGGIWIYPLAPGRPDISR